MYMAWYYPWFPASTGGLETYPPWIKGITIRSMMRTQACLHLHHCFIQYISFMCPLPKNIVGLANLCPAKKIVSSFPMYLKIIQLNKGEKVVTIISF